MAIQEALKKKVGRPRGSYSVDPQGSIHIGYRSSMEQKDELIDVAGDLGYKTVSELIRHIVDGWISTYRKTKGLRDFSK